MVMRYIREVTATIVRKGVTQVGLRLGEVGARGGTLAYGLCIQEEGQTITETVYLDHRRSKDFYQIPVGQPLLLRIGRLDARVGRWLESWTTLPSQNQPNATGPCL